MRLVVYTALLCLALPAAIVPSFAWPWHRGARRGANASAAIATLKNLRSAQLQFRAAAVVDDDGDGVGEFGYLAELAGASHEATLDPPMLSPAFGAVTSGRVRRSGYVFQVFLRGAGGVWLPEAPEGGRGPQPVDADAAEVCWLAYAWPQHARAAHQQDHRTFLIDADGTLLSTVGRSERYRGDFGPPAGLAGYRFDGARWALAVDGPDARGNVWTQVR